MEDNFDLTPLKKKKRKNSRNKGNTFELAIAKMFNKHFGTTEFCRTPGSGAFATTHSLPPELRIFGDLITPKDFKYYIECKKGYNDISLYSIFSYSSVLWKILDKLALEASNYSKEPMLILKQDRKPTMVVVRRHNIIEDYPYIAFQTWGMQELEYYLAYKEDYHFFTLPTLAS